MSRKVHSQGNVPFSWENMPGVSKAVDPPHQHHHESPKLPPPPCPPENNTKVWARDLQIPLPPCAFQPPSRSSSRKMDDPFLIAYKEVTKNPSIKKGKPNLGGSRSSKWDNGVGVMKNNMSIFSCKQSSCGVVEDSVVRLAQLPVSRSYKDGAYNGR